MELKDPTDEERKQEEEEFEVERKQKNRELFAKQTRGWDNNTNWEKSK